LNVHYRQIKALNKKLNNNVYSIASFLFELKIKVMEGRQESIGEIQVFIPEQYFIHQT
jgi:hypothetical protein